MTLGTPELLILLVIVILLFGVGKVPQVVRGLGRSIQEFRKESEDGGATVLPPEIELGLASLQTSMAGAETSAPAAPTLDDLLARVEGATEKERLAAALKTVFEVYGTNPNRLAEASGIKSSTIGRWLNLRLRQVPQRETLEKVLGAIPQLSPLHRQQLLSLAGYVTVPETPGPAHPIQLYLSCHGPDLSEERAQLHRYLSHRELGFNVEEGLPDYAPAEIAASLGHSDYLILVQGLRWVPVRHLEYQVAVEETEQVTGLFFQREGDPLTPEARQFRDEIVGRERWQPFRDTATLNLRVFTALLDTLAREARAGRAVPLPSLAALFLITEMLTHRETDLLALLRQLTPDEAPPIEVLERPEKPRPEPAGPQPQVEVEVEAERQPLRRRSDIEPELVRIPAGEFWMGTDRRALERAGLQWQDWMENELPRHRLYLPAYAIGRYPVTNAEFAHFVKDGGYRHRQFWTQAGWQTREERGWQEPVYWQDRKWNAPDLPVVGVSWYECVAYCRWLGQITGRPYRLPTEAEWEKAARGSDGRLWPWGNTWRPDYCNTSKKGPGQTTPVGRYSPLGDSPYGVADMAGNVWEWCATKWQKSYPHPIEDEWSREYLEGTSVRVVRGGSWSDYRLFARCACRNGFDGSYDDGLSGFRVALVSPI